MKHKITLLNLLFITIATICPSKEFQFGTEAENVANYLKSAENHDPRPPVIFIPGVLASRMVAWKRKKCIGPDIEIQDIVWLNLQKLAETMTYDKRCWLDCMKLQLNGSDPADCKIRPDEGISAVGELSPGNLFTPSSTSVFTDLIRMLARELGYDSNNIISAPYDWRLSPQALEKRDSFFTTMKFKIETAVKRHNRPAIIIAHSMGNNMFMYFCEWLRMIDKPKGGYRRWLRRHIWSYVGYAAPILGAPGALKAMLSGHTFGLPISDAQARELLLTFPSTLFLNPRPPPPTRESYHRDSSQKSYHRDNSNNTKNTPIFNYEEPLVIIKSSTGSSTVSLGINDVQSGDFYRWSGDIFRDTQIKHQANVLREQFLNDPLQPLTMPYRRPPIKHVIMIYGVDLPTESSFQYRTTDTDDIPSPTSQPDGAATPGAVLDTIFVEDSSACMQSQQQQLQQQSMLRQAINPLNIQAHLQSNSRINNPDEAAVVCVEGNDTCILDDNDSTALTTSSSSSSDSYYDHIKNLIETNNNNLALQTLQTDPTDSETAPSSEEKQCLSDIFAVKPNRRLQRTHVRKGTLPHSGDTTVPYVSLSYAKSWLDEMDTIHKHSHDATQQQQSKQQQSQQQGGGEPNISAFLESMFNYILSQFDVVSQQSQQQATGSQQDSSKQNIKWTEYRAARIHSAKHVLDNWVQNNKVIDPAVEMFHAQHVNTADTTLVMEVSGIDHLSITKNTYVFKLVLDHLLPKMSADLCLDGTCQPYYEAPREVEVSTAVTTTTTKNSNNDNNNWFFFNPR